MFSLFRFNFRFFRARSREVKGDFIGAAALLERSDVPTRWRSLNDVYRLRLLVLGNTLESGPKILEGVESFPWYQAPASAGDRYAREYCIYMGAVIAGDVPARRKAERDLQSLVVRRIYRDSLRVT